jgi:hypothetical protein
MLVQTIGEVPAELSLTPETDAALLAQSERVDHATVVRLLELLGDAMEAVRAGADPRTRLELALVKAARPALDGSPRALLLRIERLEAALGAGEASIGVPDEGHARSHDSAPRGAGAADAPGGDDPAAGGEPRGPAPPPDAGDEPRGPAHPPDAGGETRDLASLRSLWPAVVDVVRAENALLGALIAEAHPIEAQGEDLTLAFASSAAFLKKKAEDPANRMTVGEALRALTGVRWRLSYELREDHPRAKGPEPLPRSEEEWVAKLIDEFDAEEIPPAGVEALASGEKGP